MAKGGNSALLITSVLIASVAIIVLAMWSSSTTPATPSYAYTDENVHRMYNDLQKNNYPTKKTVPLPSMIVARRIGNNCLFDAAIAYTSTNNLYRFDESSQCLRDKCNQILVEDGLPTIPDGMPAGEQYLQALSKYFKATIVVQFENFSQDICYTDDENFSNFTIRLRHVGSRMGGHWMAAPAAEHN